MKPHRPKASWWPQAVGRLSAVLLVVAAPAAWSQSSGPVLRVGVVDGAQPCSFRQAGVWKGLAIDLWSRVATQEKIPYVLQEWPNLQALLAATRSNRVDVAVGCINLSTERLATTSFSLPFQEDGLAVLAMPSRLDLGRAFLRSLLGPSLLLLLGGFLLVMGGLSLLTWRVEAHGESQDTAELGAKRSFARIFQILATGPGSNTIVKTTRGHLLVFLAYLVRIVSASLLVGFLTIHVVEETRERARGIMQDLQDLRGLRVAVRPGSISAALVEEMNRSPGAIKVKPVAMPQVKQAIGLLQTGRADAVLADELQLSYVLAQATDRHRLPILALQGLRPESQGFAYAPELDGATAKRIDLAISRLKRAGEITQLRQQALLPPGAQPIR